MRKLCFSLNFIQFCHSPWGIPLKSLLIFIFIQKRPAGRADFLYKLNNRGKLLKVNVMYKFAILIAFSYDEFRWLFRLTYFDFGKEVYHVTALLLPSWVPVAPTLTPLSTTKAVLERWNCNTKRAKEIEKGAQKWCTNRSERERHNRLRVPVGSHSEPKMGFLQQSLPHRF